LINHSNVLCTIIKTFPKRRPSGHKFFVVHEEKKTSVGKKNL
jgi:hypothetical protein